MTLEDAQKEMSSYNPIYLISGITENKDMKSSERFSLQTIIVFSEDSLKEMCIQCVDFKVFECRLSSKTIKEWMHQFDCQVIQSDLESDMWEEEMNKKAELWLKNNKKNDLEQ